MQQKSQSEIFSSIINPDGVNTQLFIKACDEEEVQPLVEFVVAVEKILKLYDKPGRANPFAALPPVSLTTIIDRLRKLEQRLKWTVYQLKIRKIIQSLQSIGSTKSLPQLKEEEQQYRKIISLISVEELLANPQILNGKFQHPRQLYEFVIEDILPQVGRQILSINDHERRYEAVSKGLNLCNFLIRPTEIEIQISKNTLLQARIFKMKYEYSFQLTQTRFLKKAANIINEAILCPSDSRVQSQLLKLLKRMYRLWGEVIHQPLYLNLRNISLFFTEDSSTSKMIKQAAIFCYSVISSKSDIKFADILQSSEDLNDLKRNEFYSSKGLTLPFQIGLSYDTVNLELPIWKYRLHLDKREIYAYPVLVQKSSTLLYWKFELQNYDIGFGIYKVGLLHKYQLEQYDKNPQCKSIVKLSKYGSNTHKMPIKGQTFLKTGLYHAVFDNSHSMVRGKEIFIELCQLEAVL